MEQHWHIQRQTSPHPDGQRRWDRAYQLLLSWERTHQPAHTPATQTLNSLIQEDDHDTTNRTLCTSIDDAPDPDAND